MKPIRFYVKTYRGKKAYKKYDVDKSILICKSPQGMLYKKRTRTLEFFLYHPEGKTNKDKITMNVPWDEAAKICYQYGTKEDYTLYFTMRKKSTSVKHAPHTSVTLDSRSRIMAQRGASRRNMNVTEFIRFLIQKYDDYSHPCSPT